MDNSEITKFLDKIINENVSEYTMATFIKKHSDNYDNILLKGMMKEVDEYITLNKTVLGINLSDEQKKNAINQRKKSGLPIPYIDITNNMDVQQRESTERLMANNNFKPIVDWERLLYPYEFVDVNKFKSMINDIINSKYQEINKIEIGKEIDFSDSKGTEKIIMLNQLGILDFLKEKEPFSTSSSALASALSGVTGINADTLRSYINPIDNPTADQKNNPLIREKIVNKINQKLISIGFNPSK